MIREIPLDVERNQRTHLALLGEASPVLGVKLNRNFSKLQKLSFVLLSPSRKVLIKAGGYRNVAVRVLR